MTYLQVFDSLLLPFPYGQAVMASGNAELIAHCDTCVQGGYMATDVEFFCLKSVLSRLSKQLLRSSMKLKRL